MTSDEPAHVAWLLNIEAVDRERYSTTTTTIDVFAGWFAQKERTLVISCLLRYKSSPSKKKSL